MHHPHPTLPLQGGGKGRGGIKFIQSDLFNQIKGRFDIIVANLPYVPMGDYRLRIKDLRYEPKKALTDNTNEWKIYQKFFEQLSCHIHKGSMVLLEIDPKAKRYLSLWAKKYLPRSQTKSVVWGFPQGKAKFYRDLNNLWRYMEILF
jgi:methylase of polypeptide subunit release factors